MDISKSFLKQFLTSIVFIATFGFATTINVPADYSTIQEGIDGSSDGDTVLVAAGTYVENITWPNVPNIQLVSFLGPEQTIIDGSLSGSVIDFGDGQNWGSIHLEGFTIKNGAANSGAGLRISFPSSAEHNLTMNKLILENNYGSSGGAMWVSPSYGSIKLLSSIVRNNTGTAIWGNGLNEATFEIVNTLIYDNEGGAYGYGNFNAGNGLKVINCTVVNNTGSGPNGGAFALNNGNVEIVNSIIFNNQPTDITTVGSYGNIAINNSIITNDENSVTVFYPSEAIQFDWSDNLYGINPNFIDESNEDFHLSDYSAAIGFGVSAGIHTTDLGGNPRPNPVGSNPDLGAYENVLATPAYVPQLINVPADYSSIQAALTAAGTNDTVLVQPGTYTENIIWPETNGIKLISAGDSSNTIIDGGGLSSVIYMNPQTATIDTTTLIQGFQITNGGNSEWENGGGLLIKNSGIKITNCLISNNTANLYGGGVYLENSLSTFRNSRIFANHATISNFQQGGAGLFAKTSTVLMEMVIVENNISFGPEGNAGGIYSFESNMDFKNVNIVNNQADEYGGGIVLNYGTHTFTDVNIINNIGGNGGGIAFDSGSLENNNLLIKNNHAIYKGGGLWMRNVDLDYDWIDIISNSTSDQSQAGSAIFTETPFNLSKIRLINNYNPNNNGTIGFYNSGGNFDSLIIANNIGGVFYFANSNNSNINLSNSAIIGNTCNTVFNGTNENFQITNSTISNNIRNNTGFELSGSSTLNINMSNILESVQNINASNISDATNNYWGDASGPYHPSQNPSGQGDSVNIFVNVDPWLTTPNTDAPLIPAQNTAVTGTGNDFISLNWDESEIGDLAGYKLYYDSDSSGYPYTNSVDIGTDTSYTLSSLSLGTTYYLAVTTYDTDGNESWYSNEVSGVTRVMQAQSLDIGGDEDLQHLITHTPAITFGYYDSMNETQTSYQIQVSTQSDYSSANMWDSGEVTSSDTSVTYAGTTLADGVTYYVRAKVGSDTFYSNWSTLTFRMNSTISMEDLSFDPGLGETSVYTEGFPTVSSSPGDAEWDSVFVYYMLSDNAGFSPLVDSALVYFDEATGMADVTWQPTVDPLDNQQYWIKAKGYDGYEYGNESTTYSFMINSENDVPASFSAIYPVDSSEVSSTLPTLIWNISSDPDPLDTVRYMVQFGSTIPDLETFDTDTVTSYQFTTELEDNTDYFWRVIAEDLNGASTENNGSYQTFRVNTANDDPGVFSLISPDSGSVVLELPPLLVWSPTTDLDGDSVLFDIQLNGTSIGMTHHNYFFVDDLAEDMTYTWSVTATDNNGGSTQSGTWSFTVNTENVPPTSFALLSPETETVFNTQSVFFEWESSTDPDPMDSVTYGLDLHTDTTHMHFEINATSFTSEAFMDNRVYHWSVTAHDMNGGVTENIGGPRMFVINVENDPPTASTLVAPLDESIQTDLTPNFYWTEADDPDPMDHISYTMHWWPMGVLPVIYSADTDSNSFTPEENLTDNSQFGWMVTANDMHGAESSSDSSYFYTDAFPEPPSNFATVTPENNAEGIATEVEFIWEQTDDPDPVEEIHYQLVYATDWEDSSTYVYSDLLEDTSLTVTLTDNSQYYWIVVAMDTDGFMVGSNENTPNTMVVGTLSIDDKLIPEVFALHQNYPNPFNPTTQIKYDLPEDAMVSITIYDVMGRSIRSLVNTTQSAGYRSIQWDATNNLGEPVSAGMYIYMIQAGKFRQTKKMVLLK